jgi:hypothetical protein
MATLGNGMIVGLAPWLDGMDIGDGRGGMDDGFVVGDDGVLPGKSGPVLTSVMRVSMHREAIFHSPHQSSSRT